MGLHVTMVDLLAVRNVEVMTAVNGEVANVFVHPFNACQPRFVVRQRFHTFRIGRVPVVIGKRDSASCSVRSLASLIPRQAVLLVVGYLAPNLHRCPAFEARPLMCLLWPARLLPVQPPSHRPEYDSGSVPLPSLSHTRVVRQ